MSKNYYQGQRQKAHRGNLTSVEIVYGAEIICGRMSESKEVHHYVLTIKSGSTTKRVPFYSSKTLNGKHILLDELAQNTIGEEILVHLESKESPGIPLFGKPSLEQALTLSGIAHLSTKLPISHAQRRSSENYSALF